ncbi:MAG: A/G-specific adenine glycosylase [Acidobacteria bacterium]|nr:A/G-specific adenine glycosylase [Acidobacteriota bacterium]
MKRHDDKFSSKLQAWYARAKRVMPWRGSRDPYRIWISEVMLQQTRVAAVVPYYEEFLRRFPIVRALARAKSEDVLKHWAGLGYYSRARNLHSAAKEIVTRHGGQFPRQLDQALALPGIGAYTAAAVLSIAFDEPLAVLDGNVARVLARLHAIRGDLRATKRWKILQNAAQELMNNSKSARKRGSAFRPGDWNQAMMELGASICTPRSPNCGECPVAAQCQARKLKLQDRIPEKRKKQRPVQVHIAAGVFLDAKGRTLLIKENGAVVNRLFSGMWQFPATIVRKSSPQPLLDQIRSHLDLNGNVRPKKLAAVRHSVTNRELTVYPYLLSVNSLPAIQEKRAVRLVKINDLPISSATRKIAERAQESLSG